MFETVNLALSSPPLSRKILAESKVYLFLLIPSASNAARSTTLRTRQREKIVGCVIAQPITTAMRTIESVDHRETSFKAETISVIGKPGRCYAGESHLHQNSPEFRPPAARTFSNEGLITVDASTSLFCSPEPLPTPLGIPRMFVSSSYRRFGIASRLLTAVAENFIHGIVLDPTKGEVAFTQPTASGKTLMEKWGKKGARIYRE